MKHRQDVNHTYKILREYAKDPNGYAISQLKVDRKFKGKKKGQIKVEPMHKQNVDKFGQWLQDEHYDDDVV